MYSNYFMIDQDFLSHFPEPERNRLEEKVYLAYSRQLRKGSKKLSKEAFFSSSRTKYSFVYFLCPKCKSSGFAMTLGKRSANGLKYCPDCGEANISHRYRIGRNKIIAMIQVSQNLSKHSELVKYQNQQLLVLICSVLEVYLRELYADILNTKFVVSGSSLYEKFLKDCKNDFLNPGKTQDRLKKELNIDYKAIVGKDVFKVLTDLSNSRNVVVHNNGICDSSFLRMYPEIERHSELSPKTESVIGYLHFVDYAANKLDKVYQQILLESAVNYIIQEIHKPDFELWQQNIESNEST